MATLVKTAVAVIFASCTLTATAGSLSKANIVGQVQQFLTDGRVSSCGVSLVAIEGVNSAQDVPRVFQGSFMLAGPGGGLMKGRAATVPASKLLSGKFDYTMVKALKTERVWAKAQGADATTVSPGEQIRRSDDPGYIIYVTPLKPLLSLITAIFDDVPIQVGTKASGDNIESVLYGKVVMSDEDKGALAACLGDWKSNVLERPPTP